MMSKEQITSWLVTDLPTTIDTLRIAWEQENAAKIKENIEIARQMLRAVENRLKDDLYMNL